MTALLITLMLLSAAPESGNYVKTNRKVVVRVIADNALGSGVVVQTTPLVVATCFHVIQNAKHVTVEAPGTGLRAEVTRVAIADGTDLAFLMSEGQWKPTTAGEDREPWVAQPFESGDQAVVLGFGNGNGTILTPLSSLRRLVDFMLPKRS